MFILGSASLFSTSNTSSNPFGSTSTGSASDLGTVGNSPFGSSGTNSANSFGDAGTSPFESTSTGSVNAFGATGTSSFGTAGTGSANAFGATGTSPFGSTSTGSPNAFGATGTSSFGSTGFTPTSAFGTSGQACVSSTSTPVFGSLQQTFGSSSQSQATENKKNSGFSGSTFGSQTGSSPLNVGAPANQTMPVFGVPVTTPATNLFGSFTSQSQNSTGFFSSGGLTGGATSSDFASSVNSDSQKYTPIDQLTPEELEAFRAPTFTLGRIPTKPPPKELVF